jgi:hypothetical protein
LLRNLAADPRASAGGDDDGGNRHCLTRSERTRPNSYVGYGFAAIAPLADQAPVG